MALELKTLSDIHTSIFEKAQLTQTNTEASNLVLRLINENYTDIAQLHRWRWLQSTNSTVVPTVYQTGTITVSNGAATVVGSGVSFTASMVNRKIHLDSENDTYLIASRVSATRIILDASYRGTALSGAAFRIYQDSYKLATDCEELLDVYYYPRGAFSLQPQPITNRQMINMRSSSRFMAGKVKRWTHGNQTTSGTRVLEIWPPADNTVDYRLRYDYIKRVTQLSAATQQPLMPVTYRSAIMWGALSDLFMREGHVQRMNWAQQKKMDKVNEMRKDWEVTDRRPRLMFAHDHFRARRVSPARFDLGTAFDDDTWGNDWD